MVPPQRLHQGLLEVLQLVGHAARSAGVLDRGLRWGWGALGHRERQRGALEVLIEQGGLADTFARAGVLVHHATGQPDKGAAMKGTERPENGEKDTRRFFFFFFSPCWNDKGRDMPPYKWLEQKVQRRYPSFTLFDAR